VFAAAAITTDYDTLLALYPAEALVSDAQKRLDALLEAGTPPEQATRLVYDTLLAQSTTPSGAAGPPTDQEPPQDPAVQTAALRPAQEDPFIPLQPIDIKAIVAKIDRSTLQRVSPRRIEFRTTDGFPCLILATPDYSSSGKCSQRKRRQLLLHISDKGSIDAATQEQQHESVDEPQDLHLGDAYAAAHAAAAADAEKAEVHTQQGEPFLSQSGVMRSMLQESSPQCATPKGEVLILAPYFVEHTCAFGEEASEIAALFAAAGYRVTFKCNDPVACPEGPPSLEDYTCWSKYAFVMVSTTGDSRQQR
jgi:hypothetical protein